MEINSGWTLDSRMKIGGRANSIFTRLEFFITKAGERLEVGCEEAQMKQLIVVASEFSGAVAGILHICGNNETTQGISSEFADGVLNGAELFCCLVEVDVDMSPRF